MENKTVIFNYVLVSMTLMENVANSIMHTGSWTIQLKSGLKKANTANWSTVF